MAAAFGFLGKVRRVGRFLGFLGSGRLRVHASNDSTQNEKRGFSNASSSNCNNRQFVHI